MNITEDLRKEIKDDIAKCESHTEAKGSESLYRILLAKYSMFDLDFVKGLSNNGKASVLGSEFDYRQELKAIAAKLEMWLSSTKQSGVSHNPNPCPLKAKVDSFIERGKKILILEKHIPERGIAMPSYVSGPLLDAWMSEIKIFNERHLKHHPLYDSIHATYSNKQFSPCEDMLGHLRALAADEDFWQSIPTTSPATEVHTPKTMDELLANDILRLEQYIANPDSEKRGQSLYTEITSKYDSVIKEFGNGLYQYIADQHFYDPEISGDTLIHNLSVLLNKMKSYRAQKYNMTNNGRKSLACMSNKIFIVHGHDEAAKESMARTLEKIGFEAIILHEQASSGKTIMEKMESFDPVPEIRTNRTSSIAEFCRITSSFILLRIFDSGRRA